MWFSGYVVIWLSGYLAICLSGYLAIWLSGYLIPDQLPLAAHSSPIINSHSPISASSLSPTLGHELVVRWHITLCLIVVFARKKLPHLGLQIGASAGFHQI